MSGVENVDSRKGRQLLEATRPFAEESTMRSWYCVVSTLVVAGTALATAALLPWWPARLVAAVLGGLVLVRTFILYHDFMHGALLRQSGVARGLFYWIGLVFLTPPRYWRYSHNFHHGNVGKPLPIEAGAGLLVTSDLGAFPLMSTAAWRLTPRWPRLKYRLARHPLTLLCAYFTVFLLSLCVVPLFREPRKYWDGSVSLAVQGALVAALWLGAGFWVAFFAFVFPFTVAAAAGAYLFYAQHNSEGMLVQRPDEWTYYLGATESSSYMKLSPIMHWFTGNIGYHHVHHLNPRIPFYRLPEALAAVPELQVAGTTSLRPRHIVSCLHLNLWDPDKRCLVSYGAANQA